MREPIEWSEPAAARAAFIELTLLLSERGPVEAFGRLVGLAQQAIPSALGVSLVRLTDDDASHLASSSDLARTLDDAQRRRADGPSIRAALIGEAVHVRDLRRRPGWPDDARAAIDRGAVSCFAVPVPAPQVFAALTVYGGSSVDGSDALDRYLATRFACFAASALGSSAAAPHPSQTEPPCGRGTAGESSLCREGVQVDRAVGVLIERYRLTASQAAEALERASAREHTATTEVAARLLDSGYFASQHLHPSALGRRTEGAKIIPFRDPDRPPRPPR